MPDPIPAGQTLSLSAARRHDALCDQLENGWQAGTPPAIEDLLAQVPPDERAELFAALFRVELHCRPDGVQPAEYQARFPDFAPVVETLMRDPGGDTAFVLSGPTPAFQPPPVPGYEVLGRIGSGGMGVVFRARHIDLGRPAAIKMIKAGEWSRPEDLIRFQREARSVARLDHPNIVRLYEFGQVNGLPYYVMELVETGSLDDRLDGNPIDPVAAAGLVEPLARAVQYFHDHDIIHRDLKPANVLLVGPTGPIGPMDLIPKITDFGLAKKLTDSEPGLTGSRAVLGTACYMAPEQAAGKKDVSKPADVYSLGAILYELLTGRPPFHAESYGLTVAQVLTEDPPRPSELVSSLPADIEAVCLKCLEKDPAQRYASAADLAEDLRRFREGLPVQAGPDHVLDRDARWARKVGYEILDLLGCTRWAFLYTAVQSNINRKVLLKLSTGRVGSPQHAALKRQAGALAGLDHPNVLRLYDYGEQYGQPYLTLEYVEGGRTLSRLLRDAAPSADGPDRFLTETMRNPIAPRRAAELVLRVALGLQGVHQHGVLHLGLHPGAVVLAKDDVPKLTGFESARRVNEPLGDDLAPPPEAVPPNYVPPELLAGRADRVGPATDVYALGAILYDLLTGLPPFLSATLAQTRERVRAEAPTRPGRIEPKLPPDLEAVCLKALEKDPGRRYSSAGALALDLQRFLAPPPPPPEPMTGGDTTVGPELGLPHPGMTFRLVVLSGPARVGDAFELPRGKVMLGRSKECEVLLPGQAISRVHCGVVWNGEVGRHELMDYGSKNGSFVNNERVKGSRLLRPGDLIQVPDFVLRFEPAPGG